MSLLPGPYFPRRPTQESSSSDESSNGSANNGRTTTRPRDDLDRRADQLAWRLSRLVVPHRAEHKIENPFFSSSKESELNPTSQNFNPRLWIRNLLAIQSRDPERYPSRTAGISFRSLAVHGFGSPTDYQKDAYTSLLSFASHVRRLFSPDKQNIRILREFDGLVKSGEMLMVLGRPGSGCSTLLKTIAGETEGLVVESCSTINYQGISAKQMHGQFRGETIYTAENDAHFPQLTVGQTLFFAAKARAPRNRIPGVSRDQYAQHMRDFFMAVFGLTHTMNTRVGSDYVRGVSGGERKRVSIAEAALSQSPLQCWDNSTRGLDSANAIEFCKTLRMNTNLLGAAACVSIYQAPESAYEQFDKVIVLFEGRQIYFGPTSEAKDYFTSMGFVCSERQTTADFLTSITSPEERLVKPGINPFSVPRTADDFATAWRHSTTRRKLTKEIEDYESRFPLNAGTADSFLISRRAQQAKGTPATSSYTISIPQQISICITRGFDRLRGNPSLFLSATIGNTVISLVLASVFFNLQPTTESFYSRGALIFTAIMLNAFSSSLEILTLYEQRPIVEKHARYALYHPFAEAVASMICDMPYKLINATCFNSFLYFLTNLRRTPEAFLTFLLFSISTTLTMSMLFRTIGASSRSLSQALAPGSVILLALVIYTGFTIPTRDMLGWARWINYLNPIAYAFESLMINEFTNRSFDCALFIPSGMLYDTTPADGRVCATLGSFPGSAVVDGDEYLSASFQYSSSRLWSNLVIIYVFMFILCGVYLLATEYISSSKSKGEVLLFRRGHHRGSSAIKASGDEEKAGLDAARTGSSHSWRSDSTKVSSKITGVLARQRAIFHWQDVCYDIKVKGEERRILDHIDGWVKPGTITALMGVSGAGKTTLLDVLATRITVGVVSGDMLVDGRQRDSSFQRKTGYVQQQDIHLPTTTVREALRFSAVLRQPASTPHQEKLDYVEEVVKLLNMEEYADAVVGVPGEGLNIEQRKRLTIGVELVAKPQLLLFLDEPTSGLDSQTSWSIFNLLDSLRNQGQAILCTIHQPSATLFQRFDRLLLLAAGGKTVYFGDIGKQSATLINYFQRNGVPRCQAEENPAEWMLEAIGAAPGSKTKKDWHQVWKSSPEFREINAELGFLKLKPLPSLAIASGDMSEFREFAAPFAVQVSETGRRVFSQYWRTPAYIYSKLTLSIFSGLLIGFSFFMAQNSLQGLQSQVFAVFMLLTIFGNLVQQIMPNFVVQRALYETRERSAKIYSWQAFVSVNIGVELVWNTAAAILIFLCWYYPIGLYGNAIATDSVTERSGLMFLFIWAFLLFTSTFSHMAIAGLESTETAGNLANVLFSLSLMFCGVISVATALPSFWTFMYYVSPFTYLVSGMLSTGIANTAVNCADIELLTFQPYPQGSTCSSYMTFWIDMAGGYLANPDATADCKFCAISETNTFLAEVGIYYADRWRNLGIVVGYIVFNIVAALALYWLMRVPKKAGRKGNGSKAESRSKKHGLGAKLDGGPLCPAMGGKWTGRGNKLFPKKGMSHTVSFG